MKNPFHVSEIREAQGELRGTPDKIKAFENAFQELRPARHLETINEKLEGQCHSETGVKFEKHSFVLGEERVEGVFPVFESKFDTALPRELYQASDAVQFKCCTEQLKDQIARNPAMEKQFSPRQLEQIRDGAPRISGLTWHHNELPGKMQLVNAEIHAKTAHIGGRSLWACE